jgi:putative DNA methylase
MHEKRFIEEAFPVKEVSFESAREKGIRRGNISTLHIWWARRPLAASRSTNYASLIAYDSTKVQETRDFITSLSRWKIFDDLNLIQRAKQNILKNNDEVPPKVLDPFGGGGQFHLRHFGWVVKHILTIITLFLL